MKYLLCPTEFKELTETGSFEGIASMYGNVDLGGDIVEPGAFKEIMKTSDGAVRILDSHNTRAPIGKGIVTDTHVGLAIKGQLNLKLSRARDAYEMMKDGVMSGLSIGFDILKDGATMREDGVRLLRGLKLWEVSVVTFPMNMEATVSAVKTAQQITTIREFESFLREVGGFSKEAAKILAKSYKDLPGQRDADDKVDEVSPEFMAFLKNIKPL